jgi:hypothetical protein
MIELKAVAQPKPATPAVEPVAPPAPVIEVVEAVEDSRQPLVLISPPIANKRASKSAATKRAKALPQDETLRLEV